MSSSALSHDLFLDRYRPLRPLGSGGMGQVWLARDERSGLDVALKIVAREGKTGHRAEREARAASSLRHERCQRILSLARDPSHVYIAYEYIPGRTLRQAMRAGEIDDRAALQVAAQISDALAHAHGKGIVHRDVKPSNVLLAEHANAQPGRVDVRLLDFGLAQMAEFDTLTALGDVPGTLAYIAPERLQGLTATSAADVWGVGVLLWEALAGEHPFWGGDLVETSRLIQQGAPSLATLRPDLPQHVLETVASALLVNPQRRPSAERLAAQLRELPKRRRKKGGSKGGPSRSAATARPNLGALGVRILPGALTGLASGWIATRLPFYPQGWPLAIAGTGAALGFAAPRLGLLFALAVAFFPLANISLGLGILFAAAGAAWVALTWKDARAGLLLAAGPLLAPLAALGFLPLAAQLARGRARRATQAFAAVLLAALIAGLRKAPLPLDGSTPPLGLGITGSTRPTAVAHALWAQLAAHPVLLGEALVLAVAAALLPYARNRGPWPAAAFGAALLAGTALTAPAAAVLPLVAAAWLTAGTLALQAKS
ncbi:MAG TPA: serine/threonine-protein kinase [Gaiellaceae bacterium]|nr:serine/threonine-protein kinase [Gaiellaceae bacterium]